MSVHGRSVQVAVALGITLVALNLATPARAQNVLSGPDVVPDRTELNIGERVAMRITGFDAQSIIMTVCGNNARRGSVDCDLRGAQAREMNRDGTPTLGSVIVGAPPAPCPCVIRVVSDDNAEVAVAEVTVVGHPVGEIVEPTEFVQPLVVEIDTVTSSTSFGDRVRSSLGGSTTYEITVRIRNRETYVVDGIRATASYTRERYDDTRTIAIDDPGTIEAGDTWEQVLQVETPALTIGDVTWRADVSGTGPPVEATASTSSQPTLLYVVAAILLLDLLVLLWRLVSRRRRARSAGDPHDTNPFLDGPGEPEALVEALDVEPDRREPQLAS